MKKNYAQIEQRSTPVRLQLVKSAANDGVTAQNQVPLDVDRALEIAVQLPLGAPVDHLGAWPSETSLMVVLMVLIGHLDARGRVQLPGLPATARMARCDVKTVRKALKALVVLGFVALDGDGYALRFPDLEKREDA